MLKTPTMTEKEAFAYLNALRASGATNMWAGAVFLQRECGISRDEAKKHFLAWMHSFKEKKNVR